MFKKPIRLTALGRKAQSTVEYIVLVAAVIAVAIAFMTGPSSPFQSKLNSSMGTMTDHMDTMATRLEDSTPQDNSTTGSPAAPFSTNVVGENCGTKGYNFGTKSCNP
jgi:hypothetical protein